MQSAHNGICEVQCMHKRLNALANLRGPLTSIRWPFNARTYSRRLHWRLLSQPLRQVGKKRHPTKSTGSDAAITVLNENLYRSETQRRSSINSSVPSVERLQVPWSLRKEPYGSNNPAVSNQAADH